ncbi:MAG TPA: 50S ribosomal protein L23 [Candidatus Saccharimonadales bacterium]|nr:50S ribosomal protein L23 [Candidatus Saccharimonadales bacterium]
MKTQDIVKKPILSEKAYLLMAKGMYTFLVDKAARKEDIKKIVARQFSVSVEKVTVTKIQKKTKRIAKSRKTTTVGGGKKATVWLKKGQSIASLLPKVEKKKVTKKSGEKEVEVNPEGKA